jgi:hypothetical protein
MTTTTGCAGTVLEKMIHAHPNTVKAKDLQKQTPVHGSTTHAKAGVTEPIASTNPWVVVNGRC